MLTAGGSVQPVLTDESGRSLTLPFGARQTLVEVPYPAALPAPAADGAIVAIFSSEELSRRDLEGIGSGQITPPPNVLVARATVDEGAAPR